MEYTEEFDRQLAEELEVQADDSALVVYAIEHTALRDQLRTCR